jgi:hypothetical protein
MKGWEFTADLITKAYWPVVVGTAVILFRKRIGGLIDRIRKGKAPGGWEWEADPQRASVELVNSVANAAEPARQDDEERQPAETKSGQVEAAALDAARELERRIEIERVARDAARWGQEMAETMPPRPGSYWVPKFDWSDDGKVRLTYGQRVPGGADIVWMPPGSGKTFGFVAQVKHWKAAQDDDAEGNDSRQD